MGQFTFTPGEFRKAVGEALSKGLSLLERQQSTQPIRPTLAPRSTHPGSFSVVVGAVAGDPSLPKGDGGRYVDYTVDITLLYPTGNPGGYEASLNALYTYADEAYKAIMGQADSSGLFACVPFEFIGLSEPQQGDAEYQITLTFEAQAFWSSS